MPWRCAAGIGAGECFLRNLVLPLRNAVGFDDNSNQKLSTARLSASTCGAALARSYNRLVTGPRHAAPTEADGRLSRWSFSIIDEQSAHCTVGSNAAGQVSMVPVHEHAWGA